MPCRGAGAVSSDSFFAAGWRPTAAWICVIALGYQLIARPLGNWVIVNFTALSQCPPLNDDSLMTLVMGLLGLGVYRTAEKVKGV